MEENRYVAKRPYIIYKLPFSRTTQALRGGKIQKVWENVERFLLNCTTADINVLRSIYLDGFTADEDHGEHPGLADQVLQRAREVWGDGETRPIAHMNGSPVKQTKTEWKLISSDLKKALDFMVDGQPYPKYNLGPLDLILSYHFKLIDVQTREELPDQQFVSSFLIWLSRNSCVSASLCFPFQEPNEEFWKYVDSIREFIPFKFDEKHLRLGRANKNGTSNVFTKIQRSV